MHNMKDSLMENGRILWQEMALCFGVLRHNAVMLIYENSVSCRYCLFWFYCISGSVIIFILIYVLELQFSYLLNVFVQFLLVFPFKTDLLEFS